MSKTHFKSTPLFVDHQKNVDRALGAIKNIVIVQEGLDKEFGFFTTEWVQALTAKANEQTQGVKSRFGHPNMCKTTLGTFLGRYKNFRHEEGKVFADLYLDPITKKTQVEGQGISMFDYIMDMSETNPDMFGNSIHYNCPMTYEDKEVDGEMVNAEVYQLPINAFYASDLVDTPAATDELFKGSEDLGILVTQFLDENPQIFKAVQKDESIIADFIKRYDRYVKLSKSKNEKMGILKRLQKKFSTKKDIDVTLADGSIATVITDLDVVEIGDPIQDAQGAPLADGDYVLPDGETFVVGAGVITDILTADSGTPHDTTQEEEIKEVTDASTKSMLKGINDIAKAVNGLKKDVSDSFDMIADKQKELETAHKVLAKSVKSKGAPDYNAEDPKKKKSVTSYDPEKAKEAREARNKKNQK